MTKQEEKMQQSTLTGLRVKPIDFARICGVSKQSVSAWIKTGKITLPPDGFLEIQTAAAEYIKNTPANKVKASVFKVISADDAQLKNQITVLSSRIGELEAELSAIKNELEKRLDHTKQIIEAATVIFMTVESMIEDDGIDKVIYFLRSLQSAKGFFYELEGADFGETSAIIKFDCSYLKDEPIY